MSKIVKQSIILVLLCTFLLGCSPGLYTRVGSTAPVFGPLCTGMTRQEAEKYLGKPILKILIDKDHYKNIYEYEKERSALFTASTDMADVLSLGLTNLLISPLDRFNGTKHLIAIVFEICDSYEENDRITCIMKRVSPSFSPDPV